MGVLYKSGQADSIALPGLYSQADTKLLITNPTIEAGDFKIWNSVGTAWANLATTPTVIGAATSVLVSWSAAEAAYSPFVIVWQDASGSQWCSGGLSIRMGTNDIDDLPDAVHDEVVEGALTLRQIVRVILAALAGKSAGGGTTTVTFRDNADAKARITATVDTLGDRTAITLDGS